MRVIPVRKKRCMTCWVTKVITEFRSLNQCHSCYKANLRQHRKENIEAFREKESKKRSNNRERYREHGRKSYAKLSDSLVTRLVRNEYGIPREDVTEEMVVLKRAQLKFHKLLTEVEDGITGTGD